MHDYALTSIAFFMTHIVGYPIYTTGSPFYERYDSILNYVLGSVVWCIRLVVLEVMKKEKGWLCMSE